MSIGVKRKHTMFGKRKWKRLAEVVRLDSPSEARESAIWLKEHFRELKSREHKVAVKRACVLARNRALAARKRKNLSAKEKKEFLEISKIYERAYKSMKLDR